MLNIIIILVLGSVVAYISKFNLESTSVNLGGYVINDVPLFYVIIASVLTGLILSYLFLLLQQVSNSLTLRGKRKEIKTGRAENLDLTKRIHQLEIENERLKNGSTEPSDRNAL
ncbi:MAG: hypothetical protein COY81_03280 [Candidatus Pacebacteria bacterium CG_4_10_14_0_8_um_filter_43_12]|nr:MAG: hypothetical protein COY81_03280 [Candidatus Pacebacteria bacterium CG_4_10_14_0_8_um_filter_43_12]